MKKLILNPATKCAVAMGFLIGIWQPAVGQTPDSLAQLYACKTVKDADQRLACYDKQVGFFEQAQKSGDIVAVDKAAVERIEKESFGLKIPSLPALSLFGGNDADKVESPKVRSFPIQSTSTRTNGYLMFTLDNGQVWIQTQPAKVRHLGKADPDMLVIRKAALGSYLARVNDKGPRIRIKRVE